MIWFLLALATVLLVIFLAIGLMVDGGGASRRRPPMPARLVIWFLLALATLLLVILLTIGLMVDGGGASRRRPSIPAHRLPAESVSYAAGAENVSPVHRLIDRTLACIRKVESDHRYAALSPDDRALPRRPRSPPTTATTGPISSTRAPGVRSVGAATPHVLPRPSRTTGLRCCSCAEACNPWPFADGCAG